MYTPSDSRLIPGLESMGEYIRNTAIVNIIDNDSKHIISVIPPSRMLSYSAVLQINFEESDYSIYEGSSVLSSLISFTFRTNQNPFSVTLTPATIDIAENMSLGDFINSYTTEPTFRATEGVYFSTSTFQLAFFSLFSSVR